MAIPLNSDAGHRVTRILRDAGATGPGSARPLASTRPLDRRALDWLVSAGVVREAGAGRYYLDADAYRAYRARRLNRMLIAMGALLFLFAVLALTGVLR
ncbi:MAG TPA: hypothetical protein VM890_02590 [Longimicrobium sp.]|jgi:hypothetical protein|nr:hypothetical protein [Longimicrobium sp.]